MEFFFLGLPTFLGEPILSSLLILSIAGLAFGVGESPHFLGALELLPLIYIFTLVLLIIVSCFESFNCEFSAELVT